MDIAGKRFHVAIVMVIPGIPHRPGNILSKCVERSFIDRKGRKSYLGPEAMCHLIIMYRIYPEIDTVSSDNYIICRMGDI